jgi:hypothetical protein
MSLALKSPPIFFGLQADMGELLLHLLQQFVIDGPVPIPEGQRDFPDVPFPFRLLPAACQGKQKQSDQDEAGKRFLRHVHLSFPECNGSECNGHPLKAYAKKATFTLPSFGYPGPLPKYFQYIWFANGPALGHNDYFDDKNPPGSVNFRRTGG